MGLVLIGGKRATEIISSIKSIRHNALSAHGTFF